MTRLDQQKCAQLVVLIAVSLLVAATVSAWQLEPLPRPVVPALPKIPKMQPRQIATEPLDGPADPFRTPVAAAQPEIEPVLPIAPPDPIRLAGTAALPNGGVAVVESSAGSRVLRVGESWAGLRLHQVLAGEAVFVDATTGEAVTLRIRKAGS
ncbi:MAG: hypothetical protein ACT4O1_01745 [Gemmatimonadota bacterium]